MAVVASPGESGPDSRSGRRNLLVAGLAGVAVLAAAVVLTIVLVGGDEDESEAGPTAPESLPEGAVAVVGEVEDGVVTEEQFDASVTALAEGQGRKAPDGALEDQALGDALMPIWIRGEAADTGVSVSEDEVAKKVDEESKRGFKSVEEFEKFALAQGICTKQELKDVEAVECEGVLELGESVLLLEEIQKAELGADAGSDPAAAQQAALEFEEEFLTKWRALTLCAEELATDRCSNGPEPQPLPAAPPTGAPAPPGGAVPPGAVPPGAVPPGAVPPGSVPPGAVPPGAVPPGAVPPGAAPPGAVPPGAAPPGAVPPGSVPPGAVPPGAPPPSG